MSIGSNIRNLRTQAGMSQARFAERIGKTRSAVSYYESDTIIPRMGVISKMCDVLGCDIYDIIGHVEYAVVNIPNAQENELLELFRKLDEPQQQALLSVARAMVQQ